MYFAFSLSSAPDPQQIEQLLQQERTLLAHELHDSLAQTLTSLKYQIAVLEDQLRPYEAEIRQKVEQISRSIEEANTELRELIAQFRAPIDERGLFQALDDMISRLRAQTNMVIFFQHRCQDPLGLPLNYQVQILRIVREAVNNACKHSRAKALRVLLRCTLKGEYLVLIEDDGIGIQGIDLSRHPGKHIGISIMQERARRLGGELRIESEPNEGTRVEVVFPHPAWGAD